MGLIVDTTYRSQEKEIMDDLNYDGEILFDSLDKLAKINKWLGGNKVTINGLKILLKNHPKEKPITIIDLGCGSGDVLRDVSVFGQRYGYRFNLIGLDANANSIKYAEELSANFDNLSFTALNIFSEAFKALEYDIVLSTLFLHHFDEAELHNLLSLLLKKTTIGVVVNDLHRHKLAYYLFKLLCTTISNQTIVEDGLTSVLRGFKRKELIHISKEVKADFKIKWCWAFRYQWLLKSVK